MATRSYVEMYNRMADREVRIIHARLALERGDIGAALDELILAENVSNRWDDAVTDGGESL